METLHDAVVWWIGQKLSHSLGKLIEWKRDNIPNNSRIIIYARLSHSLGKLIEWKLAGLTLVLGVVLAFPLAGKIN